MAKGLAVGLNKGYVVSKIEVPSSVKTRHRIFYLNKLERELL